MVKLHYLLILTALCLHLTLPIQTEMAQTKSALLDQSTLNSTGPICSDFLGLLIDHMLLRFKVQLPDPNPIPPINNMYFQLTEAQLYGLHKLKRTCPLKLASEELWRINKMENSTRDQINRDVTLPDWMRKRDEKLADVLTVKFCLGIPSELQLKGRMTVNSFFSSYDPENVIITLADVSIQTKIRLQLSRNGSMQLTVDEMNLERLSQISLEADKSSERHVDRLNHPRSKQVESTNSFLDSYGSMVSSLVNGPLYTPIVIILESMMKDSFSAVLTQKQQKWNVEPED